MPETVACNLCHGTRVRRLYKRRDYRLRIDETEWNLVRCVRCGLGFLNPRPTPQEVGRYYPASYFSKREADMPRYERLAAYVPGERGRLLDVGTADGHFLELMRGRGWDVAGVEPGGSRPDDDDRGLDIRYGPFPAATQDLPDGSFDVVTAWAVFEHLHDPASAFAECARLLRPGGRLVIQVPNLDSVVSRLPINEDVPRHLYFYDPATLKAFGAKAGLQRLKVHHTTDLFGGTPRDALRYAMVRGSGRSMDDYFEILYTDRGERLRRWPVLGAAWTALGAVERAVFAPPLVRALRMSGQIVVDYAKPG
jgi:2-polyprenyl-3-methyl-5-hydroxy-6-metoxy-1,4-benzoquinol methylase